jgi:hypothetical protein
MSKLQVTFGFMEANYSLSVFRVYTFHAQNSNRPALMDNHFQLAGIL